MSYLILTLVCGARKDTTLSFLGVDEVQIFLDRAVASRTVQHWRDSGRTGKYCLRTDRGEVLEEGRLGE